MDGVPAVPKNGASEALLTPEEQRAQLEKVLHSETFRSAPSLQKFLEYVGSKTIDGLSHEIKEYTIGSEVFGRADQYDPRIDTTVRVQAHRLREKLKEYYEGEAAAEEILLVIPKGHYVPYFLRRPALNPQGGNGQDGERVPEDATNGAAPPGSTGVGSTGARYKNVLVAALAGTAVILGAGLTLSVARSHRVKEGAGIGVEPTAITNTGPLRDLWAGFLEPGSLPMVAYSNAAFLTTQTADLLRLKSDAGVDLGTVAPNSSVQKLVSNPRLLKDAGPVFFQDVYTGTGEVMAVFHLTQMFEQFHSKLEIKRTRLVTTEDLTHHDVIFLGSIRENALLEALPLAQDFVFAWPNNPTVWSGQILNLHPRSGESASYEIERGPQTRALRADYVLVSFLPGLAPDKRIAVLGGLTTLGTQAAAEFATSPNQIRELASRLGTDSANASGKLPPFFQVVLKVDIMKGDLLRVKYITGHAIYPNKRSTAEN
jgi:hypothetical protein